MPEGGAVRVASRVVLLGLTSLAVWLLASPAAQAHYVGSTTVVVSTDPAVNGVALDFDIQVPLKNLDFAYHTAFDADPVAAVTRHDLWLRALLLRRVALVSAGMPPWKVTIERVVGVVAQPENVLDVRLRAAPVEHDRPAQVTLHWQVVTDIVYSDKVYVAGRRPDGSVDLDGVLTHQQPTLQIAIQDPGDGEVTFATMLRTGMAHFQQGVDHQLFLCTLALGAARRRTGLRSGARRLAALTVCFTIGHSLSLALATGGWVTPPSRWVETGIALTILASAIHAARPTLTRHAELGLTVAFGIIHGFGFAATLAHLSVRGSDLVLPLVGFNVGLEVAQLVALALIVLPVWLIARADITTGAAVTAIALIALSWTAQRALTVANPLDTVVSAVFTSPGRLALYLLALGVVGGVAEHVLRRLRLPSPVVVHRPTGLAGLRASQYAANVRRRTWPTGGKGSRAASRHNHTADRNVGR